jgi:hypothetical protein
VKQPSAPTEVERAFCRPDIDQLRAILTEQFECNQSIDAGLDPTETPSLDPIIFDQSDLERSLALVAVAMATYDDANYLGLVSAGILEDIFFIENHVPDDLLTRIETEALRNPRFRWMPSGMYTDSFKPECRKLVHRLTKGVSLNDPLPHLEYK